MFPKHPHFIERKEGMSCPSPIREIFEGISSLIESHKVLEAFGNDFTVSSSLGLRLLLFGHVEKLSLRGLVFLSQHLSF